MKNEMRNQTCTDLTLKYCALHFVAVRLLKKEMKRRRRKGIRNGRMHDQSVGNIIMCFNVPHETAFEWCGEQMIFVSLFLCALAFTIANTWMYVRQYDNGKLLLCHNLINHFRCEWTRSRSNATGFFPFFVLLFSTFIAKIDEHDFPFEKNYRRETHFSFGKYLPILWNRFCLMIELSWVAFSLPLFRSFFFFRFQNKIVESPTQYVLMTLQRYELINKY